MNTASASMRPAPSRMRRRSLRTFMLSMVMIGFAGVYAVSSQTTKMGAKPLRLVSIRVTTAPTVDGKGEDTVWRSATPLQVVAKRVMEPKIGLSTRASLRSVHTDTHIYFLVSWEDPTQDISHKSWVWNAEKKAYEEGPDREDMFALGFAHTGDFTADMLSPVDSVWEIWHWKAFRTNPQGYAMDKTHRYSRSKPKGRANAHRARDGSEIWISRPEDAGETVEKKQAAPSTYQGDRVPQYIPGNPSGSTADVRAKGIWANGRWTLEFERRLDPSQPDDTTFDLARSYKMALATFDRTGEMDKASGLIELGFGKARRGAMAK